MIENLLQFFIISVFSVLTFLLTWCIHIQDNDSTPPTSPNYI